MWSRIVLPNYLKNTRKIVERQIFSTATNLEIGRIIDPPDQQIVIQHTPKDGETLQYMKARLVYQSRKRGMLENGLLLSTFAAKYLPVMTKEQLHLYDHLINTPSNDWDIYYWAAGIKPTPPEYENEIMQLLKEHVRNSDKKCRLRQPDLY